MEQKFLRDCTTAKRFDYVSIKPGLSITFLQVNDAIEQIYQVKPNEASEVMHQCQSIQKKIKIKHCWEFNVVNVCHVEFNKNTQKLWMTKQSQ